MEIKFSKQSFIFIIMLITTQFKNKTKKHYAARSQGKVAPALLGDSVRCQRPILSSSGAAQKTIMSQFVTFFLLNY
jgi:hypothetical protein